MPLEVKKLDLIPVESPAEEITRAVLVFTVNLNYYVCHRHAGRWVHFGGYERAHMNEQVLAVWEFPEVAPEEEQRILDQWHAEDRSGETD